MNRKILKVAAQYSIPAIAQSGYIIVPLVELFKAKKTPLAHLSAKEEKAARRVLDASMSYMMTNADDAPNALYLHEFDIFHPYASFLLLPMNHVADGAMSATMMLEECFEGSLAACFSEACYRIHLKTTARPELDEAVAATENDAPYLGVCQHELKVTKTDTDGWTASDMPTSPDGATLSGDAPSSCYSDGSDTSSSSCSDTSF